MCRPWHKQVHALYGNKDLERMYADLPRFAPRSRSFRKFIRWIRKQLLHRELSRLHQANAHPQRALRRRMIKNPHRDTSRSWGATVRGDTTL
jgi:hypothetical protein